MPEVTVDEDRHAGLAEDEVRSAGQVPSMFLPFQSHEPQFGGEPELRPRLPPADARHHGTSCFRRHKVAPVPSWPRNASLLSAHSSLLLADWPTSTDKRHFEGQQVADQSKIRQRIEVRVSQGEFLAGMLQVASRGSAEAQENYVDRLSRIGASVRAILDANGYIGSLEYRPRAFWGELRGKAVAFLDGGVANIDLPSAAPIGIRVGSYVVRPGEADPERRERFSIDLALVDDLYGSDAFLYDDAFEDVAKLRDAARIISEASAAWHLAGADEAPNFILLHGPLVNPAAPYGLEDFPPFGLEACRTFLNDAGWEGEPDDRQFVPVYLAILKKLSTSGKAVAGVVERSIGKEPVVTRHLLEKLQEQEKVKKADVRRIVDEMRLYALNDATLFDVVLDSGEFVGPISVNRQGPESKWPDFWKAEIRSYPNASTIYLKPADLALPFRIELFEGGPDFRPLLDLILHTSRLLPSYAFPVGLDIVDKFAKVPEWMSRGVRGQHKIVLLHKALESGDPNVLASAKRMLAARGRDWFFRPGA